MKLIPQVISLIVFASNVALADEENPEQGPKSMFGNTVQTVRAAASELVVRAMSLVGVNYKYGGNTPATGFDCSGFVSHVFREAAGVALPHSAYQMSLVGQRISSKELRPGDLVFYKTLKRAFSHVGIYIGDNKFIHSPSRGGAVEIVDMKDHYWLRRYQGARRIAQIEHTDLPPPVQTNIPDANLSTELY
jgi:cell wall-associated NlpC family hydrolase